MPHQLRSLHLRPLPYHYKWQRHHCIVSYSNSHLSELPHPSITPIPSVTSLWSHRPLCNSTHTDSGHDSQYPESVLPVCPLNKIHPWCLHIVATCYSSHLQLLEFLWFVLLSGARCTNFSTTVYAFVASEELRELPTIQPAASSDPSSPVSA